MEIIENIEDKSSVIWIDMLLPTTAEVKAVEELFDMKFPTKQESEEIELSSRYWEENNRIEKSQNRVKQLLNERLLEYLLEHGLWQEWFQV